MAPLVKDNHKSTYKKVVVRRLDHGLMKGFVDSTSYLGPNGIRMLDREGRTLTIPLQEIKGVFFVRDFDGNPQRSERKLFQSRPRLAGLWVRDCARGPAALGAAEAEDAAGSARDVR